MKDQSTDRHNDPRFLRAEELQRENDPPASGIPGPRYCELRDGKPDTGRACYSRHSPAMYPLLNVMEFQFLVSPLIAPTEQALPILGVLDPLFSYRPELSTATPAPVEGSAERTTPSFWIPNVITGTSLRHEPSNADGSPFRSHGRARRGWTAAVAEARAPRRIPD